MNYEDLTKTKAEHERRQKSLSDILEKCKLVIDPKRKNGRYSGDYKLPERSGYQTLHLSMPSFDPQQRKSYPDIEARIIHDITERPGSDQEIQHVYLIKKVPDGDLILESSIRDLT